MPKLRRPNRFFAATFFFMAAAGPILAWYGYLFAVDPSNWAQSLEYALSAENEYRHLFLLLAVAGIFSVVAAVTIWVHRRVAVARGVLVGGAIQFLAYAVLGAWFLSFVAALPLWWTYKAEHEV